MKFCAIITEKFFGFFYSEFVKKIICWLLQLLREGSCSIKHFLSFFFFCSVDSFSPPGSSSTKTVSASPPTTVTVDAVSKLAPDPVPPNQEPILYLLQRIWNSLVASFISGFADPDPMFGNALSLFGSVVLVVYLTWELEIIRIRICHSLFL